MRKSAGLQFLHQNYHLEKGIVFFPYSDASDNASSSYNPHDISEIKTMLYGVIPILPVKVSSLILS